MRVLKTILIILLVLIGIYLLVSLFLPSKYDVSRSVNINGSKKAAFSLVNDFKNWEKWSPWLAKDSTMTFKYSDDTEGEGASYSWTSEEMGNGNQQIARVSGMDTINTVINFEGRDASKGYWYFTEKEEGRIQVTWGIRGKLGFFSRVFGLFMDGMVGNDFEAGLSEIKYLVASQKVETVETSVNSVSKDSLNFFSITKTLGMDDVTSDLSAKNWGRVINYIGKEAENINGAPFVIYHEWNEETRQTTMEFCIPIDSDLEATNEIKKRTMAASSGVEVDFYGPYELTGKAHMQIEEYGLANDISFAGIAIEIFVTNPSEEADTSKWLTKVYYPIL